MTQRNLKSGKDPLYTSKIPSETFESIIAGDRLNPSEIDVKAATASTIITPTETDVFLALPMPYSSEDEIDLIRMSVILTYTYLSQHLSCCWMEGDAIVKKQVTDTKLESDLLTVTVSGKTSSTGSLISNGDVIILKTNIRIFTENTITITKELGFVGGSCSLSGSVSNKILTVTLNNCVVASSTAFSFKVSNINHIDHGHVTPATNMVGLAHALIQVTTRK